MNNCSVTCTHQGGMSVGACVLSTVSYTHQGRVSVCDCVLTTAPSRVRCQWVTVSCQLHPSGWGVSVWLCPVNWPHPDGTLCILSCEHFITLWHSWSHGFLSFILRPHPCISHCSCFLALSYLLWEVLTPKLIQLAVQDFLGV